jgi:zinc/manganese transport system substrate-binding protein
MRHLLFAFCLLAAMIAPARGDAPLRVVASFSILADLARNVAGDLATVDVLVGANANPHAYTPTPQDVRRVADAQLMIVNGLGFEGWLPRLVQASGSRAMIVTASSGITPIAANGDTRTPDPHAWQSVANAKIYAGNIRDALMAADPAHAESYRRNGQAYLAQLDALDADVRSAVAKLPANRRAVISTHSAFAYFGAAYGLAFIAPAGVSTNAEPSARDVAAIVRQIRKDNIPAVFLENVSDPRLIRRIAEESGAKVGGTLYSDALTDEKGDAPTYIAMVRHNINTLTGALSP